MSQNTTIRFVRLALTLGCVIGLCPPASAQASHQTQFFTEEISLEIPSCGGETVLISGTVEDVFQTTVDPSGAIHLEMHFTPHLTAVGEASGAIYHAVGPARITSYDAGAPSIVNGVNIIRLVAPGSDDNLVAKETIRLVIDGNGEVHIDLYEFTATCRG